MAKYYVGLFLGACIGMSGCMSILKLVPFSPEICTQITAKEN